MSANSSLSQWEIDALLGAARNPEASGAPRPLPASKRNVKPYDFRRPDKFSKDHLRALQDMHGVFARTTAAALSSYLRSATSLNVASAEQAVYGEYVSQLATPTIVHMVELQPLPGHILIETNMQLALAMLDRVMGGTGRVSRPRTDLTDMERAVMRCLSDVLGSGLKEAWSVVADVRPKFAELALTAEFVQAALPGDIVALVILEVRTLGVSGTMSICIPHSVIEPIIGKLSSRAWFAPTRRGGPHDLAGLEAQLHDARVPVSVELGRATMSVRDLVDLGIGDVIRLNRSIDEEVALLIGGRRRFTGRPGTVSGNRAIQVASVVPDDESPGWP
jgi:flagellar motor switch protein FliM